MNNLISGINPYTFTGSAILIGLLLVNEIPVNEQSSIGNRLQLVGLVMQTYTSQADIYKNYSSANQNNNEDSSSLESLKNAIDIINKKLNNINDECHTKKH